MAASDDITVSQDALIDRLPDEVVGNILIQCTTPTFIQLIRARKEPFFRVASSNRKLLLHHLANIPGDKNVVASLDGNNDKLFLLLRQRAVNNLYGINFTANMTEHLNRSADLNLSGCSIAGLDADYVRMALCFKGANDIRQYTNTCNIKEKIKQPVGGKLLKLRQHGRIVSCLYQFWNEIEDEDLLYEADYDSESDSEHEDESDMLAFNPFPPSANAQLTELCRRDKKAKDSSSTTSKYTKIEQSWYYYRITHFDVYTIEDSVSYSIKPIIGYIPRDFVVQSTQHCAILWDEDTEDGRPTENAKVINYKSNVETNPFETLAYEEMVVWPKTKDTPKRDTESDSDDLPERLPERIAFFKDGRRLKLYEAGGVVPYEVLSTSSTRQDPFTYASTNRIGFTDLTAHVDTPFYGSHGTFYDDANQEKYCFMTWLCLGICTLDLGDDDAEQRVLCILRAQSRLYPDDCDHRVSFSRMAHIGAGNATVVARLWGWEEMHTNLTGAETVSVSPGGTRIAISMWNKVYVYPLNPRILCQETVVESDDEDKTKLKKKKKRKFETPWETKPSGYYQRKKDRHMENWRIAEIRPVVLDLEGAVAHKMSWSPTKGRIDDLWPNWRAEKAAKASGENEGTEDEADVGGEASSSTSDSPSENTVINTNTVDDYVQLNEAIPAEANDHEPTAALVAVTTEEATSTATVDAQLATDQQVPDDTTGEDSTPIPENKSEQVPELETTLESVQASAEKPTSSCETDETVPDTSTTLPIQSLLPTLLPTPPAQLNPTSSPEQTSKILPRKEKSIESKSENTKSQSLYSISPSKVLLHQQPPPPSPMKESLKSKKTVAQMLESGSASSTTSTDSASAPIGSLLSATVSKEEISEPAIEDVAKDAPTTASSAPKLETPKDDQIKDEVVPEENSSKESVETAPTLEISKVTVTEITEDAKEEKVQPHKRVTEDELVILTDRGIQIWKLGATAKGLRKKYALPMEESLCGRLPLRKGKAKEPADDE